MLLTFFRKKGCEIGMQFLSIGVADNDDIEQYFLSRLSNRKNDGTEFTIDRINDEGTTSVICSINDKEKNKKPVQYYNSLINNVSTILADYIVRNYEERLISRIINTNYCYFSNNEKKQIYNSVKKILDNEDKNFVNNLFQIRRRNIIIRKLLDYFESSNSLILDGFVNFRLKDYIKDLEEIVDKAVDGFLMEREYREFIKLLRYFVEIQEPKFNIIHVNPTCDGKYVLLDHKKREIAGECIRELIDEFHEGEISYDDLLVSSLITLAPGKVIIHRSHYFKNKELLETIKNVFAGRIAICKKCELCSLCYVNNEIKK